VNVLRLTDIEELLIETSGNIKIIESEYKKANDDRNIQSILKPKVKSSLEHLRSCLDYMAHDIYFFIYLKNDKTIKEEKTKQKIYFPYGRNENDFKSSLGRMFKNLYIINKNIFLLIESIQPYKSNNSWLADFCDITNTMKHSELLKQKRHDKEAIKVLNSIYIEDFKNVKSGIISGNIINGIRQKTNIVINNGEIVSNLSDAGDDIKIYNWTTFQFDNIDTDILVFLKLAYSNISTFKCNLYKLIM
jgi:hypothetical protein